MYHFTFSRDTGQRGKKVKPKIILILYFVIVINYIKS